MNRIGIANEKTTADGSRMNERMYARVSSMNAVTSVSQPAARELQEDVFQRRAAHREALNRLTFAFGVGQQPCHGSWHVLAVQRPVAHLSDRAGDGRKSLH